MMMKLERIWKWVRTNLILPLIPVALRIVVRFFSKDDIPLWDVDDLLYYNFFICLLIYGELKERKDVLSGIVRFILFLICVFDCIQLVLVLTGSANENVLAFSGIAAVCCISIGVIYEVVDTFSIKGVGKA